MVNNPEKLEVIEKFAKEENLLGQMEKRKQVYENKCLQIIEKENIPEDEQKKVKE